MMEVIPPGKTLHPFVSITIAICVMFVTIFVGILIASPIEATMPTMNTTPTNTNYMLGIATPSFLPLIVIIIGIIIALYYIQTLGGENGS